MQLFVKRQPTMMSKKFSSMLLGGTLTTMSFNRSSFLIKYEQGSEEKEL